MRTSRWQRLPLRSQLTAVFAALLVVGLLASGAVALRMLARTLVDQLDAQLDAAASTEMLETLIHDTHSEHESRVLPSDYYVALLNPEGAVLGTWSSSDCGSPLLPELTAAQVRARNDEPFTVAGSGSVEEWRVLTRLATARETGQVTGSVVVALPMTTTETTLHRMQFALAVIGFIVVATGAGAGWWAVRTALRPLRRIEDTAAAIAEGDLSRRIPPEPITTEVGRLSTALNTMLGQIEQAFAVRAASEERMRQFVADASHELRTPLATIRGYGELYRLGALPAEEHTAAMRRIEDSAKRMGSLVEDLLHLARLDENRPLRQQDIDLAVLAADAVADLHALDPTRQARLVPLSGTTTAGALVQGDEDRLRQVVANLVGNVVQHTPAGTAVELAVGRDGDLAVLEVRDHGPGIAPEHADRVFERFYRVDAARGRESGGAGLGMAIVAAIVEAHGGRVFLEPTAGGGTTVRVSLTARQTSDADSAHSE